jgi:Type II/IV secretion system protein.
LSLKERMDRTKFGQNPIFDSPFDNPQTALIDKYADLKEAVHREVIDIYNSRFLESANPDDQPLDMMDVIKESIAKQNVTLTRAEENRIAQEIYDDVVGLGPIEKLVRDPDISEIMVNGPKSVYIERKGKLEAAGVFFKDDEHVLNIINRIVSAVGRRCDEANPMVDARLSDGSRVNAVIPPISVKGPCITIRKFKKTPMQITDLINYNTLSTGMSLFLEACVKGRCNIVVSGGTGSGKTTLLNVLSGYIPESERIITIEDAAELQLMQRHVVTLESRPANIEGKGRITIRDLVRNSLRMRPDRIIVGEVRSGEALDMLQAMNTGHDGSLTTVHANSPRDVISRIETMVLMAGMDLPVKAIREQIASAIDLIVHQARMRDGSRKIVSISEVVGMEGDTVTLQDIFVFRPEGYDSSGRIHGKFEATGIHPHILDKLKNNGVVIRDDWFTR